MATFSHRNGFPRTRWYTCFSIICDGKDIILRYHTRSDPEYIEKRKCKRCGEEECIRQITPVQVHEMSQDAHKYQHWDRCHICGKDELISSGTGSCYDCDHGVIRGDSRLNIDNSNGYARYTTIEDGISVNWTSGNSPIFSREEVIGNINHSPSEPWYYQAGDLSLNSPAPVSGTRDDEGSGIRASRSDLLDSLQFGMDLHEMESRRRVSGQRCPECNNPVAGNAYDGLCHRCGAEREARRVRTLVWANPLESITVEDLRGDQDGLHNLEVFEEDFEEEDL